MKKRISYELTASAAGWPGNPKITVSPFTSISKGDRCNQYMITLFNHFGSHMDGARHYNDSGKRLTEEPFDRFFFGHPLLIDVKKEAGEGITKEDLEPYTEQIRKADLLMLRTGFARKRAEDPECYSRRGPYVSCSAAEFLMDHFRENLKAIALDFISLASPQMPEEGGKAHQIMLGVFHQNQAVPIIEDVSFEGLETDRIVSAAAVPLFMEEADSAPVTMWVELE